MTDAEQSLSVARRVDAACDRFEAEWRSGRRPRVEDYVAAAPETDAELLRAGLLAVEGELTQSQGVASRNDPPTADFVTMTEPPADAGPVPERVGRFEVRALLGAGAFGRVYRAFDPRLGREVAVKIPLPGILLTPADRDRFLYEARAAAGLHHPNVCPVHEVGEQDGTPFIVMAYIPGRSLAAVLEQRTEPLPAKQAAVIVRKIAVALDAAHRKGIIHRDLKPANVMVNRETRDLAVTDFGLARGPRPADAQATRTGVVMGTPAYMSPEQARADPRSVGPAADVYALGVILYELLTGRRPFVGTATEVMGQLLHVEPEPPSTVRPGIDPRLEAACLKAMAKNPAARFGSMKEFAAAVDEYLRNPPAPAVETALATETKAEPALPPAPPTTITPRRSPRPVFVLLALLLAGGAIVLGGIIFFARTRSATVLVTVDVDLSDKTLLFILDDQPRTADELGKPIELAIGPHELIVCRGEDMVKRMLFDVHGGRNPGIDVREIEGPHPPTTLRPDPPPQKTDPELIPPVDVSRVEAEAVAALRRLEIPFERDPTLPGNPVVAVNADSRPLDAAGLKALSGLPELRRLRIIFTQIRTEDLAILKGFPRLEEITLTASDQALAHLAGVKTLRAVAIHTFSPTTDAGLAHLRGLPELRKVYISYAPVGDAGMEHLAACPNLEEVILGTVRVGDAGVRHLSALKKLRTLWLQGCPVTDAGMASLAALPDLRALVLAGTRVGDDGVKPLRELPKLERLEAGGTALTDAAINDLAAIGGLRSLDVRGTEITAGGAARFQNLRPDCELAWETRPVGTETDRAVAAEVLDLGGEVEIEGYSLVFLSKEKLPPGRFRVAGVAITENKKLTADHFAMFARLGGLRVLNVNGSPFSGAWVAPLAGSKSLETFDAGEGNLVDADLATLAKLATLKTINVSGNAGITDAGLDSFLELNELWALNVSGTGVTDAGLKKLVGLRLKHLHLADTKVTDAGLRALAGVETLILVNVQNCPGVTAAGVAAWKKAQPNREVWR